MLRLKVLTAYFMATRYKWIVLIVIPVMKYMKQQPCGGCIGELRSDSSKSAASEAKKHKTGFLSKLFG